MSIPANPWPVQYDECYSLALAMQTALHGLTLADGRVIADTEILEVRPEIEHSMHVPAVAIDNVRGAGTGQGIESTVIEGLKDSHGVSTDATGWILVNDDDCVGTFDVVCWGSTPDERSQLMLAVRMHLANKGRAALDLNIQVAMPDYFPGSGAVGALLYLGPRVEDEPTEVMKRHRVGYQTYRFRVPVLRAVYVGEVETPVTVTVT